MLAKLPEYDGSHQRFEREQRVLEAWTERQVRGDVALEEWFSEPQASDDLRDVVLFNELAAFVAHVLAKTWRIASGFARSSTGLLTSQVVRRYMKRDDVVGSAPPAVSSGRYHELRHRHRARFALYADTHVTWV